MNLLNKINKNKSYEKQNNNENKNNNKNKNKIGKINKENLLNGNNIENNKKNNNKNSLYNTRNTHSHTNNFSNMTSNNLYLEELKNKLKEKLISVYGLKTEFNLYNGPINIRCITCKNYDESINNLIDKIKISGYKYNRIKDNLFKCTKGNKSFDIEIVKIKGNVLYYLIKK